MNDLMSAVSLAAPLTAAQSHRCTRRIRYYVQHQPEAVRRLLAKRTNWCYGHYTLGEKRCLVSHVADIRCHLGLAQEDPNTAVPLYFDTLAEEIGLPAVVALVQDACDALK
jgi:hypothetical protein